MISIVSTLVLLTPKTSFITIIIFLPSTYSKDFSTHPLPVQQFIDPCQNHFDPLFFFWFFFLFFLFFNSLFGLGVLFFQSPGGPTVLDFRNCAPLYVWYLCMHLGLSSKVGHIRNCHDYYYCSRLHQCVLL